MSEGEASETNEPAPAPAKKRKKKRKSGEASGIDGLPAGFPGFARTFPDHPPLNELVRAFEQGNYARVREGGRRLLEATKDAEKADTSEKGGAPPYRKGEGKSENEEVDLAAVRRATRELLRRIEPDPLAVYMLVGSILLLAFLSIWYWSNPHIAP